MNSYLQRELKYQKKICLLYPLEWYKKNCYQDEDGDFWENKKRWKKWTKDRENDENALYIDDVDVDDGFLDVDFGKKKRKRLSWGIKDVISKKTHPEYYL